MTDDKNEKEGKDKKPNWAGIAVLITAVTAVPGVLVNTYLDYKERNTSELVQESSYSAVADSIEDLGDDVDDCMDRVHNVEKELSELRGFLRGSRLLSRHAGAGGGGTPSALMEPPPPPEESSAEADADEERSKKRRPVKFDKIKQHVQTTGEVYQTAD